MSELERLESVVESWQHDADDWRREATKVNTALVKALNRLGQIENAIVNRDTSGADIKLILQRLDDIKKEDLPRMETTLDKVATTTASHSRELADHATRLTLIEAFNTEQVKPGLAQISDNKIELAKWAAGGLGGAGGLAGAVLLIGRALGFW